MQSRCGEINVAGVKGLRQLRFQSTSKEYGMYRLISTLAFFIVFFCAGELPFASRASRAPTGIPSKKLDSPYPSCCGSRLTQKLLFKQTSGW